MNYHSFSMNFYSLPIKLNKKKILILICKRNIFCSCCSSRNKLKTLQTLTKNNLIYQLKQDFDGIISFHPFLNVSSFFTERFWGIKSLKRKRFWNYFSFLFNLKPLSCLRLTIFKAATFSKRLCRYSSNIEVIIKNTKI